MYKKTVVKIIGTVVLSLFSIGLSSLIKHEMGAPNYGLAIVIGATLTCYLFGAVAEIVGFMITLMGVYYLGIEVGDSSTLPRLIVIVVTTIVTCSLVMLLQHARKQAETNNNELREVQHQLAKALRYQENIAGTLQRVFLPSIQEYFGNVRIAATYEAGSTEAEIGGDFYDILKLNETELLIVLGDVCGKGIDAARQAAGAKYGLRSCILECHSPAEALRRLNSIIHLDPEFAEFLTIFVGILNPLDGRFTFASGGHEPPILYRQNTNTCLELPINGMVIGALPNSDYCETTIQLNKGDLLFLYTDGFSEARNGSEILGFNGLANALATVAHEDVSACLNHVTNTARDYAGGQLKDDAAAILLIVDPQ